MGLGDLGRGDSGAPTRTRRKYAQPTRQEFEECLESTGYDWEIDFKNTAKEYVYDCHEFMPDHDGIVLRIYSTVDVRTDRARSKGADAIRLVVFNKQAMRPMGGRKKTLRILTYCKNLTNKIESIFDEYDKYITRCSECGKWMVIRDGKYGEFLGCSGYPDCRNTEQIDD